MEETITSKICTKCGELKPITAFNKQGKYRTSKCSMCCALYLRELRAKNPEHFRELSRKSRSKHREKRNAELKANRDANIEYWREYDRQRYKNNPDHRERKKEYAKLRRRNEREKVNETNRKYYATHPQCSAEATERWRKRRAIQNCAEGNGITAKQWQQLKDEYNYICAYCGKKKPLTMDHIIPLSSGGMHDIDNIVPACKSCNSSKAHHSLLIFLYRRLAMAK